MKVKTKLYLETAIYDTIQYKTAVRKILINLYLFTSHICTCDELRPSIFYFTFKKRIAS